MEAYTSPACGRACGRARVVEMSGVCVSRYGFGVCIVASWLRVCGESLRVASRAMGKQQALQTWVRRRQRIPTQPKPFQLARQKVFNQHVCLRRKGLHYCQTVMVLQVDSTAPFATVDR